MSHCVHGGLLVDIASGIKLQWLCWQVFLPTVPFASSLRFSSSEEMDLSIASYQKNSLCVGHCHILLLSILGQLPS